MLLPETDLGAGERIAERVRMQVRAARLPSGRDDAPLTVSAGVAGLAPTRVGPAVADGAAATRSERTALEPALAQALVDGADEALYAAKRTGRDRTVVAAEIVAVHPHGQRHSPVAVRRGAELALDA